MNSFLKSPVFRIIQLASFTVFFGRAWQHLFFDAPFRTLFWDEKWMSSLVDVFTNLTWEEYVTSPEIDNGIQYLITTSGWLYLGCAIISIFIRKLPKIFHYVLLLGAVNLIFLAFLYSKEKFFHIGQFFEYMLQFGSPILLYLTVNQSLNKKKLIFWMKVGIALTFSCHGLYAIGYYPRPESFYVMTTNILGVNLESAILFLKVAAFMDFVIAVGIFMVKKISLPLLIYASFWGLVTSLARIWANFYSDFWMESLQQWTHETIMRLPHFLIPLALIFILANNQIAKTSAK